MAPFPGGFRRHALDGASPLCNAQASLGQASDERLMLRDDFNQPFGSKPRHEIRSLLRRDILAEIA